jgi:hypothetical protein
MIRLKARMCAPIAGYHRAVRPHSGKGERMPPEDRYAKALEYEPGRLIWSVDEPVRVGSMLWVFTDPDRGFEFAYNRWYERDHFYAGCMIGPWLFAGSRWVAPRRLKDLRFPEKSPFADPVDAGSYLSIYWKLEGKEEEHGAWALPQVWWLYNNGRGFNERTHAQTGLYDFASAVYAEGHPVSIELALHHRYNGLSVVVVEPADGTGREGLIEWLDTKAAPSLFAAGGASIASSWTLRRREGDHGGSSPMPLGAPGGRADRVVQLFFVDDEAADHWDAYREYGRAIEGAGVGRVTFAAPFLPTVVGTDTYTDQLW